MFTIKNYKKDAQNVLERRSGRDQIHDCPGHRILRVAKKFSYFTQHISGIKMNKKSIHTF